MDNEQPKKRGRPKYDEVGGIHRSERVVINLTKPEVNQLNKASGGARLSDFARSLVLKAIEPSSVGVST